MKKKAFIVLVAVAIALCGCEKSSKSADSSKSSSVSSESESKSNVLVGNYYVGSINSEIFVFYFEDGGVIKVAAPDLRRKTASVEYATYSIDQKTVTVTQGNNSMQFAIIKDGDSFTAGRIEFRKFPPEKLESYTVDAIKNAD